MKATVFIAAFTLMLSSAWGAQSITIGVSAKGKYDVYFRPERAAQFQKPPLRLVDGESAKVTLQSPGKYKTVLRSWMNPSQYADNTIGWCDLHRAAVDDPLGKFVLRPYLVAEQQEQSYTVTKYRYEERTATDGRSYTVAVPYTEQRTRTIVVQKRTVAVDFIRSNGKRTDGSIYVSQEP